MKIYKFSLILAFIVFFSSCKEDKKTDSTFTETEMENDAEIEQNATEDEEVKQITFYLESKSGSEVSGNVTFTEENGMVSMKAEMSGLSEGKHAIHIHENADCTSDDGKSAGGHWNPTAQPHGQWGDEGGYHKGDIGNFSADSQGKAEVSKTTDEWCIGCADDTKNILGKAIIVHQGVDDFTSQPSGAAGSRISCGGIIQ